MTAQTTEEVNLSLGSTYQIRVQDQEALAQARRISLFALQDVNARVLNNRRLASCRRFIIPGKNKVDLLYSNKLSRAHYGNLMVCGSVWACPICAARITIRRREEISKAIDALEILGGTVFMATYTLQHYREERLQDVLKDLKKAIRSFFSGSGYQKIKKEYGLFGTINNLEVTWSNNAGWHPHKHCLFFSDKKLTPKQISEIQEIFSERYISELKKVKRFGNQERAVLVSSGSAKELKDYVLKWGLSEEISRGDLKKPASGHFTPFDLSRWILQDGDEKAVLLFREYFDAFKGSHQIQYSPGIRDFLDLGIEKTDQELAEENTAEAVLLAQIDYETWRVICIKKVRGELLEVASSGMIDRVESYLEKIIGSEKRCYTAGYQ